MIVKVSYFIRRLDSADLSCSPGGRRSFPVPGWSSRWRGSHTFPERPADGVRPTRSTLHPTGPGDPSQGGNGYQTHMRVKGWETAREGKKSSLCRMIFGSNIRTYQNIS